MKNYINTQTLQVQTENEIRSLNPDTSFPAPFRPPTEYKYVFPSPKPVFNPLTQSVISGAPALSVLGNYEETYSVSALDASAVLTQVEQAKEAKKAAVKAQRDYQKFNGVFVQNKWIHTDTYSRTQWMAMVMMGANLPAIPWTTMDGTTIVTTSALAQAVFGGVAQLDAQLFSFASALITSIDASNDPTPIDITSGWPLTYVENGE